MGTDQFITDKPQTVQHFGLNIGRVHLCIVFIQQAFRGILPCPLAPFAGGRMQNSVVTKYENSCGGRKPSNIFKKYILL